MQFNDQFKDWLDEAVADGVPHSVRAFSFNLFQPALIEGVKFGVELVGASQFDRTNSDWACDEVWEPKQRHLSIPMSFSGETWEECLSVIQSLVLNILSASDSTASILKSRQGVGLGFVDGDLHVVWP